MAQADTVQNRGDATAAARADTDTAYEARPVRNIDMKALRRSVMARTARIRAYLASH